MIHLDTGRAESPKDPMRHRCITKGEGYNVSFQLVCRSREEDHNAFKAIWVRLCET